MGNEHSPICCVVIICGVSYFCVFLFVVLLLLELLGLGVGFHDITTGSHPAPTGSVSAQSLHTHHRLQNTHSMESDQSDVSKKEGSQDGLVLNFWPQSLQIAHFQGGAGIPLLPSHLPVPLPLPPPLVKRWQKSCCLAARLEGPHIICWAVLPPPFLTTNFPKSKRSLLVYLLYQMLTLAMVE